MNKLWITGNLTKDPEKRVTASGVTVCSFTVAVNRRRGVGEEPDFFRVTAWKDLAESCSKYLAKGKKVGVSGSVSISIFQAQDGTTRANMEVNAQDVEFLSPVVKDGFTEVRGEELPCG